MEQFKWSDKEIEQHLKNIPVIKDRRSKQEVFLKVQAKVTYKPARKRVIPTWGVPALATACVIAFGVIFFPELIQQGSHQKNAAIESQSGSGGSGMEKADKAADSDTFSGVQSLSKSDGTLKISKAVNYHEPLTAKDFQGTDNDWVTVSYYDKQAQFVVPVSFITKKGHYVDKVKEELQRFNPTNVGLSDSPLKRAKISEEEETVILDWQPGAIHEAEEHTLPNLLSLTFGGMKAKAEFRTNGNRGYEFSLSGMQKEMPIQKMHGAPHFRYDTPKHETFLVSLFGTGKSDEELPKNLQAALDTMDDPQDLGLQPLLPKNVHLTVKETDDDSVVVTFPDNVKLEDDTDHIMMIDAILLTADSYGYHDVKFNNTKLDMIGHYDLSKPIEDVTGINFYHYQ